MPVGGAWRRELVLTCVRGGRVSGAIIKKRMPSHPDRVPLAQTSALCIAANL